jgi:hypothetical protein
MRDGLVRMRPNAGLQLAKGGTTLECDLLCSVLGETVITERALLDGLRLAGTLPDAILSVENRGSFMDLQAPAGWLVVHVAGWDTHTMRELSKQLTQIPWVHFGDIDPNGVAIVRHLRQSRPDLVWFLPAFWSEFLERHGRPKNWPEDLIREDDPPLVQEMAARGLWMEQECVAVDGRLLEALADLA